MSQLGVFSQWPSVQNEDNDPGRHSTYHRFLEPEISSHALQVPKTCVAFLCSIQVQAFTAGSIELTLSLCAFVACFLLGSIGLREKISLESTPCLHLWHHKRSTCLEECKALTRPLWSSTSLSSGDIVCFLLAHWSPSQCQARGAWGMESSTRAILIVLFQSFHQKPHGYLCT